jgi:hypothetical protein
MQLHYGQPQQDGVSFCHLPFAVAPFVWNLVLGAWDLLLGA